MIYRRILSEEERNKILKKLRMKWDITYDYFWYPLYDTKIKEVISFNITDEEIGKINLTNVIKQILLENKINYLFELIEFGGPTDDIEFEAKKIEVEFRPYERFWCDKTLDWLIYLTHEGYITFGGNMLINGIKKYIHNWKKYEVKI